MTCYSCYGAKWVLLGGLWHVWDGDDTLVDYPEATAAIILSKLALWTVICHSCCEALWVCLGGCSRLGMVMIRWCMIQRQQRPHPW